MWLFDDHISVVCVPINFILGKSLGEEKNDILKWKQFKLKKGLLFKTRLQFYTLAFYFIEVNIVVFSHHVLKTQYVRFELGLKCNI